MDMDWQNPSMAAHAAAVAAAVTGDVAAATLEAQLRDLLYRFPCAALDGVRWSALGRAHRERFGSQGLPSFGSQAMQALHVTMADCAEFRGVKGGVAGEGLVRLRDLAVLTPPPGLETPPMACWPLLVKCLGDVVQMHGMLQEAGDLAGLAGFDGCSEVKIVLLAKLKPLLRRHWDPSFEERGVGYYSDNGCYCNVKKMKHLITSVLKWRADRLSLGWSSGVDHALAMPLALVASSRHNDMMLGCPCWTFGMSVLPQGWPALDWGLPPGCSGAGAADRALAAMSASQDHRFDGGLLEPSSAPAQVPELEEVAGGEPIIGSLSPKSPSWPPGISASSSTAGKATEARMAGLEREIQGTRIENAELKKRVRFGSDFLHKEIRRLRIENAELKKRLNVASQVPGQMQQVWVPVLAPFAASGMSHGGVPGGAPGAPAGTAQGSPHPRPGSPTVLPPDAGQGSPAQDAMTPIAAQGWYAVPMPGAGVVSPVGQPWPTAVGPLLAMPLGMGSAASIMSPGSMHEMRLLPRSLLSDSNASHGHSLGSPRVGGEGPAADPPWEQPDASARAAPGTDDRWLSIPSGIVERQVAQIQSRGGGDPLLPATESAAAAAAANASARAGGGEVVATPCDTPERHGSECGFSLDADVFTAEEGMPVFQADDMVLRLDTETLREYQEFHGRAL